MTQRVGKQEQTLSKHSQQQETIKVRAETNKMETKNIKNL